MLIAQVSDPHLSDAGCDPATGIDAGVRLTRVLEAIGALIPPVDGIVVSGDLVEHGTDADYRRLARILETAPAPVWLMVGNHDDRGALGRAFPGLRPYFAQDRLRYVIDGDSLRLVLLDSLVPGNPGGALDGAQMRWLDAVLAAASTAAMVFVHHPPPTTGLSHIDRSALANADELATVLRRHPRVVRVACGHLHQALIVNWAGTTLSACPSTAHGFALDLAVAGRIVPVRSPAAFQLHRWYGGAMHTYTVTVN